MGIRDILDDDIADKEFQLVIVIGSRDKGDMKQALMAILGEFDTEYGKPIQGTVWASGKSGQTVVKQVSTPVWNNKDY